MRGHTKLHFLREDIQYDPKAFRDVGWNPDWYVTVVGYPEAEMLTTTPSGRAGEFFTTTTSLEWHTQLRRTVRPGDVFTFNARHWLYIPIHHVKDFVGRQIELVHAWSELHLRIAQLSSEHDYDQYAGRTVPVHYY